MHSNRTLKTQRGVGMIEVLITVVVLSIGLLGLAALQGFSLQGNQVSYQRTQATNLTYEILDHLRANRSVVIRNSSLPDDLDAWDARVANLLPGGALAVTIVNASDGIVRVQITWDDDERVLDADAGTTAWQFEVTSEI